MSSTIAVLAFVVAAAAGVFSTWSPCGLSMLSQINPVAERARGNRFWLSATWYFVGALFGGATLGLGVAILAAAAGAFNFTTTAAVAIAAILTLVCAAIDARVLPFAPPFLRRQVNEDWLTAYRSWVYGLGFGWQIGSGLTTYIMTSAIFAFVGLAAVTTTPGLAFAVAMTFAFVRGAAVFSSGGCTTHAQLMTFHRRMEQSRDAVRLAVVGVLLVAAALLAVGAWGFVGLVVVAAFSTVVLWLGTGASQQHPRTRTGQRVS